MLYLPPSQKWDIKDLEDLYRQLPTPALVLGDFNAHSQTWGCRDTNAQGRSIEDLMLKQMICILNTGNPTYFHPGTGSLSAVDLSLCLSSLYLDLSWSVHEDLCESDHYPVVITTMHSQIDFFRRLYFTPRGYWPLKFLHALFKGDQLKLGLIISKRVPITLWVVGVTS